MPGQFSITGAAAALTAVWPMDVRLGLYTSPVTDNALGAEYGAQGYAKVVVRRKAIMENDPPPTFLTEQHAVFGPFGPGGTGAEVGWVAAFPATGPTTANEMLMHWELDEHKTPLAGDSLVIEPGELSMACE